MTFSSIMTLICVGYVLAYGGMVIYDLFLAKEPIVLTPKTEEEEIDISDEAKTFTPVVIDKDGHYTCAQDNVQDEEGGGLVVEMVENKEDEEPEEKVEPEESESKSMTNKESVTGTQQNSIGETESEDEIDTSAREQAEAWMSAQTGSEVEAEDSIETDIQAETESDDAEQRSVTSVSQSPAQPETDSQPEMQIASLNEEPPVMTGAIEIGELMSMMDVLAEKGEDSPLGQLIQTWYLEDAA